MARETRPRKRQQNESCQSELLPTSSSSTPLLFPSAFSTSCRDLIEIKYERTIFHRTAEHAHYLVESYGRDY